MAKRIDGWTEGQTDPSAETGGPIKGQFLLLENQTLRQNLKWKRNLLTKKKYKSKMLFNEFMFILAVMLGQIGIEGDNH